MSKRSEYAANSELAVSRWLREYLGDIPQRAAGDFGDDDLTLEDPDERGYDPRNHYGRQTRK